MSSNPLHSVYLHDRVVKELGDSYGHSVLNRFGTNIDGLENSEHNLSMKRGWMITGITLTMVPAIFLSAALKVPVVAALPFVAITIYEMRSLYSMGIAVILTLKKGGAVNDVALARQLLRDNGHKPRPKPKKNPVKNKLTWSGLQPAPMR